MKVLFLIFLFLFLAKADEMSRIEAIVEDITELRSEYKECQEELKSKTAPSVTKYKKLYQNEKQKNTILKAELEYNDDLDKSNKNLSKRIKELEKEITKLKRKQNNFPKLMMKDEAEGKDELIRFKARSYKLKYDSIIYNGINGKMITKWLENTSFTSGVKTKTWIKITGYFVNKKWTAAKKDMWIKIKQVEIK